MNDAESAPPLSNDGSNTNTVTEKRMPMAGLYSEYGSTAVTTTPRASRRRRQARAHCDETEMTALIASSPANAPRHPLERSRANWWLPSGGRCCRRSCVAMGMALLCTVGVLHIWYNATNESSFWPTRHELALVEHYSGSAAALPSSSYDETTTSSPWWWLAVHADHPVQTMRASWRVRKAQREADAARHAYLESVPSSANVVVEPLDRENNVRLAEPPRRQQRRVLNHKSRHDISRNLTEVHDGCETTIVLIRHCEKGSVIEHCAYQGYERSVYLASLFGNHRDARWPTPSYIFAEGPQGRNRHKMNFREVETVGPLAEAAGIPVDDSYTDFTRGKLTARLLQAVRAGELCGRVVLLVWKHSSIAHLGRSLGCGPTEGCPLDYSGKTFDQVWQVKLVYRTWEHSTQRKTFVKDNDDNRPSWMVFGSVQYEGFDPLAVSKQFGDYPAGGTDVAGRWEINEVPYPERTRKKDRAGWVQTRVKIEDHGSQ
jgi:hypothetical protein